MAGNKYHAKRVHLDGRTFDSKREATRWSQLCLLQLAGKVRNLEPQVEYPVVVNGVSVCSYFADFRYFDCEKRKWVVEDAKGVRTAVYKLKKRLVEALYGIKIVEV